ncbi:MAG: HAMP domain-containing protein [Kouleothrix sp.]|nr:HAMP domain-containing protein [Kouleothrix sp.]
MRSLTVKLTLAFLVVGLIGAVLVAVLVGMRTRAEFDQFLSERDQATLCDALATYYADQGSWDGVGQLLAGSPLDYYSRGIALVDAGGAAVIGNERYPAGQTVPASALDGGTPVQVDGQTVGRVLFGPAPEPPAGAAARPSRDAAFLDQVTWATEVSAGAAALIALMLGAVLARTLTRPLRELTGATQAMARGNLDQRVVVRSRDEIGALATSFNQMSADLARASRLRQQMTADLAHDLRTPLSILRGYTEGLQEGRLRGAPKLYTIMHGEVEQLQRLVEDLRVLSLADAGALTLNRRAVDPAALLERSALAAIGQAEQQGIALRVEAAESLPPVLVDTDRMAQVLSTLVSGALHHTAAGEIVLSAAADDAHVRLAVSDSGSGIDPADLPFVFERFYRADKARQRVESDPSGLGLAITKALVEANRGSIKVESTLGEGTRFTITLPIARPEDAGRAAPGHPLAAAHAA